MDYFEIMRSACLDSGVDFDRKKYKDFLEYKNLIQVWNKKINLTSIVEDDEIIKKHFIDCIKVFKFSPIKDSHNFIDIGSGAGFPGIPIGIIKPDMNGLLLDSLNKRIKFLDEVIDKLNLENIQTIHGRAEDICRKNEYRESFDVSVSRAVANLTVLSEFCLPYVKIGGYFIAMKGPSLKQEIDESKHAIDILGGHIEDIIKVDIEDSELNHNLVIIKKINSTPKVYPRKAGTVSKKPLK
ncbi:16S rRNA (guanine(527)-N(7))-methyltransferase RsmG [Clostridium tyrobutyricum]|uniref:16S rRNA (guanine(527)-N(7))-methyltransferase RsmG n=1 Tax=Clostridium tyrobutyricum TaxID=1519 RepID=UPI001C386DB9|nr:16S rRNA (guanine(527)-N(7))-methyltransferase RsmG [Clostridium tyrobutyricum]MBV4420029.1 16S rRNA (guanine(527)-N(7))-methyltransferase RsmG [Clostridium tyrobutyricum]